MGGGRAEVRMRSVTVASLCAALVSACSAKEPKTQTYFDRTISPILQSSCVSTNTGANCHITQEHGNALGNLSLATYTISSSDATCSSITAPTASQHAAPDRRPIRHRLDGL
jgi:hypothetical protein